MTQILPDCMMPDGADPCAGYQQLAARVRELEAERERLRQAINRIHECVLGEWDGSESEIADVINAALGEKP